MKKAQKYLILSLFLIFMLACSLSNIVKEIGGQDQAEVGEQGSDQNSEVQPPSDDQSTIPGDTDKAPFNVNIPTEVNLIDSVLNISQYVTLNDQTIDGYKSFFVLENTSTDSADMISEFKYKITWYDENGQEVDVWENTYNSCRILPQEKVLFYLYPERSKTADHQIASTVFEVFEVITVKDFADAEWLAKLASLPITHPIVSVNPGDFTFDYYTLLFDPIPRVTAPVQVQSTLSREADVEVVGLYLNADGDLIGVGKSDPFILAAEGSASAEVVSYDLSEEPAQADYFIQIVNSSDILEVVFPGLFN